MLGAATLLVVVTGTGAFIIPGWYDIGADVPHTPLVLALITELRERSIAARSGGVEVPKLDDPARVARGAHRYRELCAGCRLAPGTTRSLLRAGLYPHPPNLAAEVADEPRRAFRVVKHGIKMSAMPAWGRSLDDATSWDIVAFLQHLPAMSAANYQQLSGSAGPQ